MKYQLYNDDCVNVCSQLPTDCIDLTITSIPFANLYTYSDDERDFSNVKDLDQFFKQMDYLIPELYRITRPGRIIALHVKQIPTFKGRDGAMGLLTLEAWLLTHFKSINGFIMVRLLYGQIHRLKLLERSQQVFFGIPIRSLQRLQGRVCQIM